MIEFYKDKSNHLGKTHNKEALALISKPGVGIYDLEDNLIYKFKNNVELAKYLNISKVTVDPLLEG
ncbi:putative intron-encoded endonuclease 1 [Erysiphe neolycopersici]|uniref:Putative intron-encoded endonuclease 1 n=1 Tax=Erysiphe neolycopersici TaxID=212602 RepID=A0A420HJ77_9PEZI|nr:putative intron-encoded endonuclease 1 [Erysiphe neolycopersici]